ncbi:MAG: DNA repair protein [Clostridiaceae bacterium]|nr:DNA repair protein [Clostridiaceae bacterium]
MQYDEDKKRFAELLYKFTGIKKSTISDYLKENTIKSLIENPTVLKITDKQLQKLLELKELRNTTDNLKTHDKQYILHSSILAQEYFKELMKGFQDKERFICAFLDSGNRVISTKVMSSGTVNESPVYPREIVKEAILRNANSVILAHNHPGGRLSPSHADLEVTNNIIAALGTINVNCPDHIIVADNQSVSLAERGYILKPPGNSKCVSEGSGKYTVETLSIKNRISAARVKAIEINGQNEMKNTLTNLTNKLSERFREHQ